MQEQPAYLGVSILPSAHHKIGCYTIYSLLFVAVQLTGLMQEVKLVILLGLYGSMRSYLSRYVGLRHADSVVGLRLYTDRVLLLTRGGLTKQVQLKGYRYWPGMIGLTWLHTGNTSSDYMLWQDSISQTAWWRVRQYLPQLVQTERLYLQE